MGRIHKQNVYCFRKFEIRNSISGICDPASAICIEFAWVAELVDARDLKSLGA